MFVTRKLVRWSKNGARDLLFPHHVGCPPERLSTGCTTSYDFHEEAEFLQLSVPVFGSTIYSVPCGNSDAVVKVETELVVLNRRIMFVFQRRYSFPTS